MISDQKNPFAFNPWWKKSASGAPTLSGCCFLDALQSYGKDSPLAIVLRRYIAAV